jgi:hypothetical protein
VFVGFAGRPQRLADLEVYWEPMPEAEDVVGVPFTGSEAPLAVEAMLQASTGELRRLLTLDGVPTHHFLRLLLRRLES